MPKTSPSIAIVGAGYAGLAVCWHLLQKDPSLQISLFAPDQKAASYVSTGLLHPYPGRYGRRTWKAEESLQDALELLQIAQEFSKQPLYAQTGVFRPALTAEQRESFQKALQYNDVEWWNEDKVQQIVPELYGPGLFIRSGLTVSSCYIESLVLACLSKGAKIIPQKVHSLQELSAFDRIVLAAGSGCLSLKECQDLPLSLTKGQALLCKWPKQPLPFSISGKGHISFCAEGLCLLGSTYERDYDSTEPDLEKALILKEQIAAFYPPAKDLEIVSCLAGLRIARMGDYLPLLEKINAKTWIFTGLGSRGLLYHGFFGKQLADQLIASL